MEPVSHGHLSVWHFGISAHYVLVLLCYCNYVLVLNFFLCVVCLSGLEEGACGDGFLGGQEPSHCSSARGPTLHGQEGRDNFPHNSDVCKRRMYTFYVSYLVLIMNAI
jgi:hypothetical protein